MQIPLNKFAFGTIFLKETYIIIDDKSGRTPSTLFQLQPFMLLAVTGYNVYVGISSNRLFYMVFGVVLLALTLLLYHSNFKRTNQKEIELSEIANAKFKNTLGFMHVDFVLKNGSTRRIFNLRNQQDWLRIKNHLDQNQANTK